MDEAAGSGTLYEEVAGRIEQLIAQGTLRPGERIPSIRRLHRQWGVSVSTVLEAYRRLEDRGWVEARPQSGYYVKARPGPRLPEPGVSAPPREPCRVDMSTLGQRLVSVVGVADFVKLCAAVPDAKLLPTKALGRLTAEVSRRVRDAHDYAMTPGRCELRRALAARMVDAGCTLGADELVVTSGAQEAVWLALATVTRPGDAVAVPAPTYFGTLEALQAQGLRALEIPTDPREGMDLEALERVMAAGAVRAVALVANFGNPLGTLMSDARKEALCAMAARWDVAVVEDDIYGELPFEGGRPKALKAFDAEGRVVYCASVSKTLSPGLRIGWAAPGRYLERFTRLKRVSSLGSPTVPQLVVAEYLASGAFDRHLRRLRTVYRDHVQRMIWALGQHMPPGTRVTRPQGGHVVWVEMPERVDSVRLFDEAWAAGVSMAPGPMFSASGRFQHCMRLNAAAWSPAVEDAIARLGGLVAAQLR